MGNRQRIAAVSVINDLVSDSRVKKIAETLMLCGFKVRVIGRRLPESPPLPSSNYETLRMRMFFRQGPAFYFFFQIRLFFLLLSLKADLLYANDLDTLLPNYLVSRLKNIPLIYDSHEIFCEVPELQNNKIKKRIWETLERFLVPRIHHRITVNKSIADYFFEKYAVSFEVVRNIPQALSLNKQASRRDLNLPEKEHILILQGAGINIDRGAEELVSAMRYVDNAILLIIGSGDVWERLEQLSASLPAGKVRLIRRLPKSELIQYTLNADVGISIDKDNNLNYLYSLPNKLFDYMQCGLPVLVSRLPEIEKIVNQYGLGEFISDHRPETIAAAINGILDGGKLGEYKTNAQRAAADFTWEKEMGTLVKVVMRASDKIQVPIN